MRLLVTGGSGTIGYAICDYLIKNKFDIEVVIYSRDEQKQETMYNKYKGSSLDIRYFIGDVRDKARLNLAVRNATHIIHAAALKIVPAMEYNPIEAVKTNIQGSQNLIECVLENQQFRQQVMLTSTDKAVHPVNLYGATKLCAEKLMLAANNMSGLQQHRFKVARYGNVAGSRGSVIPIFIDAIKNKRPITITNKYMTRFYISQETAASLVVASILNGHDKDRNFYIPSMSAYNVEDLALAIWMHYEGTPATFKYNEVGIRSGEKLHECIVTQEEAKLLKLDYVTSETTQQMSIDEIRATLIKDGLLI